MHKAEFWIDKLELLRHPEGGFYRETWRSGGAYSFTEGPFNGPRSFVTAIHYLLRGSEYSKLHRIHSDELWFYHAGAPLTVHIFPETGEPTSFTLGLEPDKGQVLQETAPAESWFGASIEETDENNFALVSCVVAPGFDFHDFAFADKNELQEKYPLYTKIIDRLT